MSLIRQEASILWLWKEADSSTFRCRIVPLSDAVHACCSTERPARDDGLLSKTLNPIQWPFGRADYAHRTLCYSTVSSHDDDCTAVTIGNQHELLRYYSYSREDSTNTGVQITQRSHEIDGTIGDGLLYRTTTTTRSFVARVARFHASHLLRTLRISD